MYLLIIDSYVWLGIAKTKIKWMYYMLYVFSYNIEQQSKLKEKRNNIIKYQKSYIELPKSKPE